MWGITRKFWLQEAHTNIIAVVDGQEQAANVVIVSITISFKLFLDCEFIGLKSIFLCINDLSVSKSPVFCDLKAKT